MSALLKSSLVILTCRSGSRSPFSHGSCQLHLSLPSKTMGVLLKCGFWFCRSGVGDPGFYISNKLSGDADTLISGSILQQESGSGCQTSVSIKGRFQGWSLCQGWDPGTHIFNKTSDGLMYLGVQGLYWKNVVSLPTVFSSIYLFSTPWSKWVARRWHSHLAFSWNWAETPWFKPDLWAWILAIWLWHSFTFRPEPIAVGNLQVVAFTWNKGTICLWVLIVELFDLFPCWNYNQCIENQSMDPEKMKGKGL